MKVYGFCGVWESPDLGRSNLIGIIRKTRIVFKKLRFCGKRKNCSLQLTSILKRFTLTRLQAFPSRIVTFKILTYVSVSVRMTIFYMISPSPTSLDPSADENFFRRSRTGSGRRVLSIDQVSGAGNRIGESILGDLFSLECPPDGR